MSGTDLAITSTGSLWVASGQSLNCVGSDGQTLVAIGAPQSQFASKVDLDENDLVYFLSLAQRSVIGVLNADGTFNRTITPSGVSVGSLVAIRVTLDSLYVCDSSKVYKLTRSTGQFLWNLTIPASFSINDVVVHPTTGDVYVVGSSGSSITVRRVSVGGTEVCVCDFSLLFCGADSLTTKKLGNFTLSGTISTEGSATGASDGIIVTLGASTFLDATKLPKKYDYNTGALLGSLGAGISPSNGFGYNVIDLGTKVAVRGWLVVVLVIFLFVVCLFFISIFFSSLQDQQLGCSILARTK
jgi:hypothetical protein